MEVINQLSTAIKRYSGNNAFFIANQTYTYLELGEAISKIRKAIENYIAEDEINVGLVANDDILTYASIIALWLEGKAYVPLNTEIPRERNENIITQAGLKTIIDSSELPLFSDYNLIRTSNLIAVEINLTPKHVSTETLAYILFTSGTTGQPKGVPITRSNVTAFIKAFDKIGLDINENDRCLQMFELTFDLSVMSYLVPLLKGACVYTIPKEAIKYSYIYELMEEQLITVALMVPSILQYLRPYFKEINLPQMKYSLFCGEALSLDITEQWSECIPNAHILNVYGPTEDTIFCTFFSYNRKQTTKSFNGLVSIGKAMDGTLTVVIDDNNRLLPQNTVGQLCLGGLQLTPGYWNNPEKNKEAFFETIYNGDKERFYKTGDLCKIDSEGDILYLGRVDFQVKVQGFRVELSEIEYHVKAYLKNINAVSVAYEDIVGNTEIGLVIESDDFNLNLLRDHLKTKLPSYMLPKQIYFEKIFPLNVNGKTDRNKLRLLFKKNSHE
jgi:amino acid adenylation domain-containing protein